MTTPAKHIIEKRPPRTNVRQQDVKPAPSGAVRTRVTFRLPAQAASGASAVAVAGTFNDWSVDRDPLTRQENGDFILELELEAGKEYEFRFVIDGTRWENAWNAAKYVWNDYAQCENSVVIT